MPQLSDLTESSQYEQLLALRKKLAIAIDECESKRDLAALSRQYRDVLKEIEEVKTYNKESEIDKILASFD